MARGYLWRIVISPEAGLDESQNRLTIAQPEPCASPKLEAVPRQNQERARSFGERQPKTGRFFGRVDLNMIIASIQHEDSGGYEYVWSARIYKDQRKSIRAKRFWNGAS